ncbi:MAG: glycerate kinase [bacterium]
MINKVTGLRGVAESAYRDALLSADPEEAVYRYCELRGNVLRVGDIDYFLSRFQRIFLVGAGKASLRMAQGVERILGGRTSGGLVITGREQKSSLRNILVREAGHPYPDPDGVRATEELIELVEPLGDQDLVIFCLSGGASAMLVAPMEGLSVNDLQRCTKLFLSSGMPIEEINVVRKHLSRVKGGWLAKHIFPATTITLAVSDVIGDKIEIIGSGPTAPDPSTFDDAIEILRRRNLWERMPESAKQILQAGREKQLPETPKSGNKVFKRAHHQIVSSNQLALQAAESRARRLGKLSTMILSSSVSGESKEIAHFYAALAREIRKYKRPLSPPACLVGGGETTVTLKGGGKGGRCQELALAMVPLIADIPGVVFLAAGTDGLDGPNDAAGAIADSYSLQKALKRELDPQNYLEQNDSYNFFRNMNDLVITGATGTNVMDVHILLVG